MRPNPTTRLRRPWPAALLLLALALAPLEAGALEPVSVQLKWRHHFQFAGYYAALEQGFYREAGLEVTIREGGPGVLVEDEVASGRADFGVGTSALLLERARGRDVVVLGQVFQHSAAVLVTPRRSGITSIEAMAGRRFMYSNQHGDILALLKLHGLDETRFTPVAHQGDARDLLEGKADVMVAYSFNEPYVLEHAGEPYLAFSPLASGIDFYGDNFFTTRRLAEARPAIAEAFRQATLRGWRHALDHKAETADLILARYSTDRSREWLLFEANQAEALIQPDLVELGYQSPSRWRRIGEVFAELGMLPRGFDSAAVAWSPPPRADRRPLLLTLLLSGLAIAALSAVILSFRRINRRLQAEVAERQVAGRALAERETQLRGVLDHAPIGIFLLDATGTITLLNRAGRAIWGGERLVGTDRVAEYRGRSLATGRPLGNEDWGSTRAVLHGEASFDEEVEIETFDGASQIIANSAVPLRDPAGRITGAVVINQDITARKRAEQSLRESEARLRGILDAMPVALVVGREDRTEYVNAAFTRVFGYRLEEVATPQAWFDLAFPDPAYRAERWASWTSRLQEGLRSAAPAPPQEVRITCRDGTVRHVIVNAQPVQGRTLVTFTDITERERMALELLKLQKLESVALLAGGIAHDFNNILTGILGNVSLARTLVERNPELDAILAEGERAAGRAAELAHQLLTFAKGGQPIKKAVATRPLLEATASLALRGTRVEWAVLVPEGTRDLEADEGQLHQAFTNVVINAAQAMPGGGTLTIAAEDVVAAPGDALRLAPGTYVRVSFTDTGCGIPTEHLSRIFDPYFTTKSQGSGLGLASTHSVVRRHGGAVTVRSRPGRGTTFELWLPASALRAAPAPAPQPAAAASPAGRAVLVLDDEAMIRDLVTRLLERQGYRTTTCATGEEAVALYREARERGQPFDVVLMDLTIRGGLGGAEAARLILEAHPAARLVVSSGYSNDPVMADPAAHGFRATVAKPYRSADLASTLKRVLEDAADG